MFCVITTNIWRWLLRLNPGARWEHLTAQHTRQAAWLLVTHACPVYLVEERYFKVILLVAGKVLSWERWESSEQGGGWKGSGRVVCWEGERIVSWEGGKGGRAVSWKGAKGERIVRRQGWRGCKTGEFGEQCCGKLAKVQEGGGGCEEVARWERCEGSEVARWER